MGERHSGTLALSFLTRHPASVTVGAYVGALEKNTGKKSQILALIPVLGLGKGEKPNQTELKQPKTK